MTRRQLLERYWELRDLYLRLEDPVTSCSVVSSYGSSEFMDTVADAAVERTEIKREMDRIAKLYLEGEDYGTWRDV